jgi:hypothetical protein
MQCAGLIYGPMVHHIDHVAVMCDLMEIPLVVTDELVAELTRLYYPTLKVIHWDYLDVAPGIVKNFDTIICSLPRPIFDDAFFLMQTLEKKHVKTIWMPHGNSDKENLGAILHEKVALVYGPKMIDTIRNTSELLHAVTVGNFRRLYWEKQTPKIALPDGLILYAPTWNDLENSTSFFEATSLLIQNLPPHATLVIKPHPNLPPLDIEKSPRVYLLKDFPPIYPLLEKTALYIGDASSIGYDFLTFNRPMFFLNQNKKPTYLMRCGVTIHPENYKNIYTIIEKSLPEDENFSKVREDVYNYTFGKGRPWQEIKAEILQAL